MTKKISDFRPISLITSFYKIIAKVLSGRLRGVLHETIHSTQGAFVQGRQILDLVLIANEIVDERRRSGEEGVVFKIDFEKAYDHVRWDFLDQVLEKKGFNLRWRKWMSGCLSSVSYAVMVNGSAKVLGPTRPFSWNLNFHRNLTDSKIEDLEGLMQSLDGLHLSPSAPNARFWPLSSSGLFSVKSFFLALSQFSGSPQAFLSKFVWNSQVPFKVKSFVWLVAHKKVNTNDMLQVRIPYKALSLDICILCMKHGESVDHIFPHCSLTIGLWHRLFQLAKMDWVPPRSIFDMMSIKFNGFGSSKRGMTLWQAASITLIRVVWGERNARIFEDKARNSEYLWDSIVFLASLWAFCSKVFMGIPLNVIQLDWIVVCTP
uniref:Reverse transcriptase domain-containing protein n=1 Tax=Vitis vinifera TaxID=29760 RepID=A5BXH9_VITVI|nr:hypothetical protein VITISV_003813 [Vitis vinifera]